MAGIGWRAAAWALTAVLAAAAPASALPKVKIAIGGAGCLCYLPTVLAGELGAYERAGVTAELINFKGGSQALTAVLGGSADVVSGYYDHCVDLVPKGKSLVAFVTYDRYPGLVLAVSPKSDVASIKALAGHKVGVTAPGSSTDFFIKYLLRKEGIAPDAAAVIGIGADASAVAAMEQGLVDAGVMLDPGVTLLRARHPDLKILSDTRSAKDTLAVFGGDYPGGVLYAESRWIAAHPVETQALADAIVMTLDWIAAHSPEELMAKMPAEAVGEDKALYLAALKNMMPMYSTTGRMDPKGAEAVLAVFAQAMPEVAEAHIDLSKTYDNGYVEKARQRVKALP